jgi:TRAP-type transport system periplasmic protein
MLEIRLRRRSMLASNWGRRFFFHIMGRGLPAHLCVVRYQIKNSVRVSVAPGKHARVDLMKNAILSMIGIVALSVVAFAINNEAAPIQLQLPTEYAANSGVGVNLSEFARAVTLKSDGRLSFEPKYIGDHGYTSSLSMMDAIATGTLPAADVFGGSIAKLNPVFARAAAPFLAPTFSDAKRYHQMMRPAYETAFRQIGVRLLYVTPWPPTGIWSRHQLKSVTDLRDLSLRTYDDLSKNVFSASGANAQNLPFGQVLTMLEANRIDAVLSSGDGGMGKALWKHLPYFNAVNYAFPLSFTVISEAVLQRLDDAGRHAVEGAAIEVEALQWQRLSARIAANHKQMAEHGVTVVTSSATEFAESLSGIASQLVH